MSSPFLMVCTFALLLSFSPTLPIDDHVGTRLELQLKRVGSGRNLTALQFIRDAITRGRKRLQSLMKSSYNYDDTSDDMITSPVFASDGEYLMDISIGTPPLLFSAILDTGSDLTWLQCQPCLQCFNQSTPLYNPLKSSSFGKIPCSGALCDALDGSRCTNGSCTYIYTYADGSFTKGYLGTETLTFQEGSIPQVAFGCSDFSGGSFSEGSGIAGFGRGPLSLVSQLHLHKEEDGKLFSYCLTPFNSTKKSTLFIGGSIKSTATTPLIKNPALPSYYYIELIGIRVGEVQLPINTTSFEIQRDGSGGLVIDSGTTLTYLEDNTFHMLKKELISQIQFPVVENDTVLELCFNLSLNDHEDSTVDKLPKLIFNFQGGVDLELTTRKYMIGVSTEVSCLAMGTSDGFGLSILGNFQQQDVLVVYDLGQEALAFVPKLC